MARTKKTSDTAANRNRNPLDFDSIFSIWRILFVSVTAFCLYYGISTYLDGLEYQRKFQVATRKWSRSIGIYEFRTVTREDWANRVPANAAILRQEKKVRSYKKVQTGYRMVSTITLGRRTTRKEPVFQEEPVMDSFATYTLDDWDEIKRLKTEGSEEEPTWPRHFYSDNAAARVGEKKAGGKEETYVVVLEMEKGKTHYFLKTVGNGPIPLDVYKKFTPGSKWEGVVNSSNELIRLKMGEKMTEVHAESMAK